MPPSPSLIVEAFPAIGLAQLDADAALRDRVDTKYVVPLDAFARLASRLTETHAALEIDGRRAFAYRSTYFDTADLGAFRDHMQQRRRRYKCRSREYLDSGSYAFEVKLKGLRGRTVKHRMEHDSHELSDAAIAFLRDCLDRAYGTAPGGALRPALAVAYTRVTLTAPALGERLTCDFDLTFEGPGGAAGGLDPGMAIVESKSARGNALADRVLRELSHRPQPACSKYCLGVALTRAVAGNPLRPLLRRHFFPVREFSSVPHGRLMAGGEN
ncbi:MAG TPA: polyphosphate polymerase domain-containing protein [Solirubrobacteraceae bacterium]|nr:polyphosphate polymerase domain-containing protein [Solirubrobacteraceae bacterium]